MLSILICTKDRQELVNRQIEYIRDAMSNSKIPYELLIYDDGSDVPIIIKDCSPSVRLIRGDENVGLIAARNVLIRSVNDRCEFVAFIDDDIFLFNMDAAFNAAMAAFKNNDSIAVASIPFVNLPLNGNYGVRSFGYIYDFNPKNHKTPFFFGGCSIHRRRNFDLVGNFEDRFYFSLEEEDMCYRLWSEGYSCILIDGINSIGIHDQPANKLWNDRYVYLLSNRLLFYRRNISSSLIFYTFASLYVLAYLYKTKSTKIIRSAISRYLKIKDYFRPSHGTLKFIRFLFFRNFHAEL